MSSVTGQHQLTEQHQPTSLWHCNFDTVNSYMNLLTYLAIKHQNAHCCFTANVTNIKTTEAIFTPLSLHLIHQITDLLNCQNADRYPSILWAFPVLYSCSNDLTPIVNWHHFRAICFSRLGLLLPCNYTSKLHLTNWNK